MTSSRVRSISPGDPNALRKVIEALEVSEGVRGDANDRKPTIKEVREMLSGSANTLSPGSSISGGSSGGSQSTKPTGIFLKEDYDLLIIGWDWPSYNGHGGSEVFRSSADQLASSELIGHTSSNYFIDLNVPDGNTYYYFVRHKKGLSLGAGTGPYAASVQGSKIAIRVQPEIKAGLLSLESPVVVSLMTTSYARKVGIEISAMFYSTVDYDDVGASLLAETGNAVTLEIKRGATILANLTPTKIQTSHADANGQIKYVYSLTGLIAETAPQGLIEYTLTPSRLFPANIDDFEISYSITVI
jgi:hypothetical protein